MNFDGLTDAVTNLTGTLILLVVLILELTHPARRASDGAAKPPQEQQQVEPLLQRMQALELATRFIDGEISALEKDLSENLEPRVKALEEKAKTAPPPRVPPTDRVTRHALGRTLARLSAGTRQPLPTDEP